MLPTRKMLRAIPQHPLHESGAEFHLVILPRFLQESPLFDCCRRYFPIRGDSELLQRVPDLPASAVVELQREGPAIVGDGAFILPDESERIGAAKKRRRHLWIEPDRLVEVLYRTIISLPPRVDEAAIAERGGVVGIKPDDLVKILDGLVLVHPFGQIGVEVPL